MTQRRLPVRSCRVVGTDDVVETHHSVQCPTRGHSVSFARCCGCSHLGAIDVDPDGAHGAVDCLAEEDRRALPHGRVDVAEAAVRVRLGDVLATDTTCVRSNVTIEAVVELLVDDGIRAVPVVDETRRLVGIVSKTDLLRPRGKGKKKTKIVADIMTPVVHGLPEDAPVAYAISLMAFEGLHEVPIVDQESHVIGMITANDALRWVAQSLGYVVPASGKAAAGPGCSR